jgi:hypothetical protein
MGDAINAEGPPWDRLPNEPLLWYARFERFRLAGTLRSLTGLYNEERATRNKRPINAPPRAWVMAQRRWNWCERAEAWDLAQLEAQRVEWATRREALRVREWEAAQKILDRVDQMLGFPLARVVRDIEGHATTIEPADWKLRDVARLLGVASHVARLAAGSETERVQVTIDDVLTSLPEEFRETVRQELAALVRDGAGS